MGWAGLKGQRMPIITVGNGRLKIAFQMKIRLIEHMVANERLEGMPMILKLDP